MDKREKLQIPNVDTSKSFSGLPQVDITVDEKNAVKGTMSVSKAALLPLITKKEPTYWDSVSPTTKDLIVEEKGSLQNAIEYINDKGTQIRLSPIQHDIMDVILSMIRLRQISKSKSVLPKEEDFGIHWDEGTEKTDRTTTYYMITTYEEVARAYYGKSKPSGREYNLLKEAIKDLINTKYILQNDTGDHIYNYYLPLLIDGTVQTLKGYDSEGKRLFVEKPFICPSPVYYYRIDSFYYTKPLNWVTIKRNAIAQVDGGKVSRQMFDTLSDIIFYRYSLSKSKGYSFAIKDFELYELLDAREFRKNRGRAIEKLNKVIEALKQTGAITGCELKDGEGFQIYNFFLDKYYLKEEKSLEK